MQMDQIGKGISARRKQLGLSQEELAGQLGVTRQAVSRWESGAALPSVDNMIELSRALQISVDELLCLSPPDCNAGISAQTVGLLLDEHSARQEKRIKRLSIALMAAALMLAGGILLSALLGMARSNRMEARIDQRIRTTNNSLTSAIANLDARISTTIQQAVSDGNSRLSSTDYAVAYDHDSRAFVLTLQAWPQVLGEYSGAEFSCLLADGTRCTAAAELADGCFQGTIIIPDAGQDCISGEAHISWIDSGETVTERITIHDIWTYFYRLVLTDAGMNSRSQAGSELSVQPYAEVFISSEKRELHPVHIRYDILSSGELLATHEEPWPINYTLTYDETYRRHTVGKWISLPGVTSRKGLVLQVTVTDAAGRDFTGEFPIQY